MAFLTSFPIKTRPSHSLVPANTRRRRPPVHRVSLTATQPSVPVPSSPQTDPLEDVDPNSIDEDCPVYCYVACSPTRSDYLERVLTSRVYDVISETPVQQAALLSARVNNVVWLKREDTTMVKSFKIRGAYNMMAKLPKQQLAHGVVAASAGNHAQGVAYAANVLNVSATIVMPAVTPRIKVDAVRRLGAAAILHGDNFDAAKTKALLLAEQSGAVFIPPFDHPDVIAGQATVGLELIRQLPVIDAIFVPVGGGGLIAGIATVVKRLRPQVKIIGVEPFDAAAMHQSLKTDQRVRLPAVGTFADGVAVVEVGEETFRLCRDLVDDIVCVTNDEICAAIKDMFEETRSILEPAGALSVAGLKAWVDKKGIENKNLVAVTSGANTNFDVLRHVSERAEIGEGREGIFAVTIPERPGAFRELIRALGTEVNVTEFNYRYCEMDVAHVFVGVKVIHRKEVVEILKRVREEGMDAVDLTDDEMAKLHVRHLVGGKAVKGELVYRFEFPERPGALRKFLTELPQGLNITMFHYRNHGADVGRVLVGLTKVSRETEKRSQLLQDFVDRLGYSYVREDDNAAYKLFLSQR